MYVSKTSSAKLTYTFLAGIIDKNSVNTFPTLASSKNGKLKKHFSHNSTAESLIKYIFDTFLCFTISLYQL